MKSDHVKKNETMVMPSALRCLRYDLCQLYLRNADSDDVELFKKSDLRRINFQSQFISSTFLLFLTCTSDVEIFSCIQT